MNGVEIEQAVHARYSAAAAAPEAALCCAVPYDPERLRLIPQAVIERDYGCGDPTRHVRAGETVLDLGSGGGKACFLAAQAVGPTGRVIGVDTNDEMLALARGAAPEFAERVGYDVVSFRRGRVQDLRLDRDRLAEWLERHPVRSGEGYAALEAEIERIRRDEPLVADDSVDVVVSNCVLNLVRPEDKPTVFTEIFRVLRRGGRAVISDIVSDEAVPAHLRADPTLWSGCISGALREDEFLAAFEAAGFHGITIQERQTQPWQTVDGIEFRSLTVAAWKGKQGPCWDHKQAVVYLGPWRQVEDDDGHVLVRGARTAVCEKTFRLLTSEPYANQISPVEPLVPVPSEELLPFDCARPALRDPRETKGERYAETLAGCAPGCC